MHVSPERLADLLVERRWFGHKNRTIVSVEILDEGVIEDGPPALVLAMAKVRFDEGDEALYQLPLLVDNDIVRDAVDDPDRIALFGDLMAHGTSIKGEHGAFLFGGPGLDPLGPPPGSSSVRVGRGEQTNTSIVFDEALILKIFRRLGIGPNPDLELGRMLTNAGFEHIPAQVGEITYEGEIDDELFQIDLGIAQQFVPDATDGWEHLLEQLDSFYDEVHDDDAPEDRRFLTDERAKELLEEIDQLGDATASLHVLLSREELDPAFLPEPLTPDDVTEISERVLARLGEFGDEESTWLDAGAISIIERLESDPDLGQKTRVHGDYHLGQVILERGKWLIIDFEGEPLRSLEERRAKQSPLKDVAGMLRSFNYAAIAALLKRAEPDGDEWLRLEPWAEAWESAVRARFLTAYMTRAHEGHFLPAERDTTAALLDLFEIDKAIYELEYELSHRPDWTRIPRRGIEQVIERSTA